MVELPTGKMKSREGTVVDADDMVDTMIQLAKEQTEQAGKTEGFSEAELMALYRMIGLGALKFYLLRVDPKKKMIFNPQESIDLHGFTSTFVQYAHARICSILRKEKDWVKIAQPDTAIPVSGYERDMIIELDNYTQVIKSAAQEYNPSLICNYAFHLAQLFNTFYDQHSISKEENVHAKQVRMFIITQTAKTLKHAMHLLGIDLPEKM